jgi:hypothetical protein
MSEDQKRYLEEAARVMYEWNHATANPHWEDPTHYKTALWRPWEDLSDSERERYRRLVPVWQRLQIALGRLYYEGDR